MTKLDDDSVLDSDISSLIYQLEEGLRAAATEEYDNEDWSFIHRIELKRFPTGPKGILAFISRLLESYKLPTPDRIYVTKTLEKDKSGELANHLVEAAAEYDDYGLKIEFAPLDKCEGQPTRGKPHSGMLL